MFVYSPLYVTSIKISYDTKCTPVFPGILYRRRDHDVIVYVFMLIKQANTIKLVLL